MDTTLKTKITIDGELQTKWQSNKHPDNPNFMQVVNWYVWEKPDGRVTVGYNLGANGKTRFIYGLTKAEAIERFS
jgi:hypothetical protein